MAKIILIAPPYLDLYGRLSKAAGRYFPLGLGYIASYLRQYGKHDVSIMEMEAQHLTTQDISNKISETNPDLVGLTCTTPNFMRAINIAREIKKISNVKVALGGVHASALPEFILNNYSDVIDCVIIGEGEITMLELANSCCTKSDFKHIHGICYKNNSDVLLTPPRPFIENLDSIPFPARDLISQKLFWPNLHNARYHNCFSILTSRGCPYNCSFCASRIVSGAKYRMHSAEYVINEMEILKKDYKAQQLIITDDTFTIDKARLETICKKMIEKQLNLKWFCFSQVNTVTKDTLQLMKKAGCYSIGFGIESASKETLKRMGKHIDLDKALKTVRLANLIGLKTQSFFIFGSAGETKKDIENTIEFSKKLSTTIVFFNMLVPFPGTMEFKHFFSQTPLNNINWENFVAVGEQCVLKGAEISSREIEKMMAKAYIEYYLNPRRLLNMLRHIKTFYELSNYAQASLSLLKQISSWYNKKS